MCICIHVIHGPPMVGAVNEVTNSIPCSSSLTFSMLYSSHKTGWITCCSIDFSCPTVVLRQLLSLRAVID